MALNVHWGMREVKLVMSLHSAILIVVFMFLCEPCEQPDLGR